MTWLVLRSHDGEPLYKHREDKIRVEYLADLARRLREAAS